MSINHFYDLSVGHDIIMGSADVEELADLGNGESLEVTMKTPHSARLIKHVLICLDEQQEVPWDSQTIRGGYQGNIRSLQLTTNHEGIQMLGSQHSCSYNGSNGCRVHIQIDDNFYD
ncbi:MAG: hypothetical protein KAQ83_02375 [Nanoarchaeota archaeon]|nr:hypothetical protein [Nanoarchaeota archaeon]